MEHVERIKELESLVKSLTKLCQELDPYRPIPKKLCKELTRIGIEDHTDPFYMTNKLLFSMENAITELDELKSKRIIQ